MSKDTEHQPQGDPRRGIVLAVVGEQYWLVLGKEYLMAMLEGTEGYPKPVLAVRFDDVTALEKTLPEGMIVTNLWAIHPGIIERLKAAEELVEKPAPPL